MDAGAQMQALMQIIGSTPQVAMDIQRQLAAGAGPFSLQTMQVGHALLLLVGLILARLVLGLCGCAQLVKASCTAQSGDPGSGSGRKDQDTPMKGEDHAGLTEEDIQLRRIKACLCTAS